MRAAFLAIVVLLTSTAAFADPKSCSEANAVCLKPFGRVCDAGCQSTCQLRFNGCLKTGAYSLPGKLMSGLRRN